MLSTNIAGDDGYLKQSGGSNKMLLFK